MNENRTRRRGRPPALKGVVALTSLLLSLLVAESVLRLTGFGEPSEEVIDPVLGADLLLQSSDLDVAEP